MHKGEEYMQYRVGAFVFLFKCDNVKIREHVESLLRYHKVSQETTDIAVAFQLDETLPKDQFCYDSAGKMCRYAKNYLDNCVQRFYYQVLFPLITKLCNERGQIALHCALVHFKDDSVVIIAGPSGGGKSTCATYLLCRF